MSDESTRANLDLGITRNAGHIFRDREGHFAEDTPENRQMLITTAIEPENYIGIDRWGNDWYISVQADGTQVWVQVRKGQIVNGGLNQTPRVWHPNTGFSNPSKPQ